MLVYAQMMMMEFRAENEDLVSLPQGGCVVLSCSSLQDFACKYSYSTGLLGASPVDFGVSYMEHQKDIDLSVKIK